MSTKDYILIEVGKFQKSKTDLQSIYSEKFEFLVQIKKKKKNCSKKVNFGDFRGPIELQGNPKMAQILDSEPLLTI